MRSISRRFLLLMISAMMIVSVFSSSGVIAAAQTEEGSDDIVPTSPSSYIDYSPINIEGNSALSSFMSSAKTSYPDNFNGSGTKDDPFVIQGLSINGGYISGSYCIQIKSTTSYLIIRNCSINEGDYSLNLCWDQNVILENNTFNSCYRAIRLYVSSNIIIRNNDLNGNGLVGILLDGANSNNYILNNTCHSNTGSMGAIYLFGSTNDRVENNTCYSNKYGLTLVESSTGNYVINNTIRDSSSYGIYATCGGNYIFENYLISNNAGGVQAYDSSSNQWNTTTYGNRWSTWTTPDADGNGIVDNAYLLDGGSGATDHYPLANVTFNITRPSTTYNETTSSIADLSGWAIDGRGVSTVVWSSSTGASGVCALVSHSTNNKSWSVSVPLIKGNNYINLTMTDISGREYSASIIVFYDSDAPTAVFTPTAPYYNSTGSVNVSLIVSDDTILASANWTMYFNGTMIDGGNVTALVEGKQSAHYSDDFGGLNEGTYEFHLTVNDTTGKSTTYIYTIFYDTTAPVIDITSPTFAYNTTGAVNVVWDGSDATSGIDHYCVSVYDGDGWTNYTVGAGVEHMGLQLDDGLYTVTVIAVDHLGFNASDSVSFIVDTVGPSISITYPSGTLYNNTGSATFRWSSTDAVDHYAYNIGSGDWTTTSDTYATVIGLADGTYTINVRAFDEYGNYKESSVTLVVDRVAPVISWIASSAINSYNNTGSVTISWTVVEAGGLMKTEYSLDGTTWLSITGTKIALPFADGAYTVHIRVTDHLGKTDQDSVSFTVDTVKPTLAITSPSNGTYSKTGVLNITFDGHDETAFDRFEYSINGSVWTIIGHPYVELDLNDGRYTVYVRAYDLAGNYNETSVTFIVDTIAPTVTGAPSAVQYLNGPVSFWVNASDASPLMSSNYTIYRNGALFYLSSLSLGTMTNENGHCNYAKMFALDLAGIGADDGTYVTYITLNDSAGNSAVVIITSVYDTADPAVEIVAPGPGYSTTGTIDLTWSGSDVTSGIDHYLIVVFDGSSWTNYTVSGSATLKELDLGDGTYNISVAAVDKAGNDVTVSIVLMVDTVVPTAECSLSGNGVDIDRSIVISFSEAMNRTSVAIKVNGVAVSFAWNGNNATLATLLSYNMEYTVNISGYDLAGNRMSREMAFSTVEVGTIEGVAVDDNGALLANVTVTLGGDLRTTTDANGHFIFANVTVGSYRLTFEKEGYKVGSVNATIQKGETNAIGGVVLETIPSDGGSDNGYMLIMAGISVVITIALVGVFLIKKRKP